MRILERHSWWLRIALLWWVGSIGGGWLESYCAAQPWDEPLRQLIDEAPPHIRRLIDQGEVRFEVDDEKLQKANREGLAEFHFQTEYRATYHVSDRASGGAEVAVRFPKSSFELKHTVTLSSRFMEQKVDWRSILLLHEMDHVAISSDPRVKKLALQAMFHPFTLPFESRILASNASSVIGGEVEKVVTQRREAIQSIMQEGYRQLDERSNNGREAITSRQDFFAGLYTDDWLKEAKFPFLDSCKKLVRSKSYQSTEHYRLLDLP